MTPADNRNSIGSLLPANWRQLALLGCALLLALAGLNLDGWHAPAGTASAATHAGDDTPDIIIDQPHIEKFGEAGKRSSQLEGTRLTHYEGTNRSLLDEPRARFTQVKPGQKPVEWQLQANSAWLYHDSQNIDLQGNVLLSSDDTPGGRTEIATEQLLLDVDRQYAETDKAVTIRARRSEAHAAGLKADLANERLVLPARVKETHESRRR